MRFRKSRGGPVPGGRNKSVGLGELGLRNVQMSQWRGCHVRCARGTTADSTPGFSAVPAGLAVFCRRRPAVACRAIIRCSSGTKQTPAFISFAPAFLPSRRTGCLAGQGVGHEGERQGKPRRGATFSKEIELRLDARRRQAYGGQVSTYHPRLAHCRAHLPSDTFASACVRAIYEICIFPFSAAEIAPVTAPFHARDALELLDTTTKWRWVPMA